MNSKFPGFTAVSDKVHVFTPSPDSPASGRMRNSDTAPTTVLICTWGDGSTKHIAKYIDGYRTLYQAARIVLAQSTMYESMFHTVEKHNKNMLPLLETLFRPEDPEKDCESANSRTLVHIMSNSGGLSFVSSIMAYQNLPPYQRKQPFPHVLLVCDSTPGGLTFGEVVSRASRAMAIATSSWVPLPIDAMHGVWAVVMFITLGMSRLVLGGKEMGWTYAEAIQDPKLTSPKTTRLYLYSKADELVSWKELEKNVAVAQGKGYNCIVERFEKSPHVGHAHMYPERYWGAVAKAWETALVNQGKLNGRIGERGRL